MKKSIFNFALALLVLGTGVLSANAFMGSRQMTPERFAEFKAIVMQSDDAESFQEAMKTIREGHRAEMESMRDSITHSVENIENGVVKTITSDDADVVIKIQSRGVDNAPQKENVTRTVENLSNGIQVTTTSDDPEIVERMQNRADRKGFRRSMGQGRMGNKGGHFGKAGFDKPENWDDMEMEERRAFMQDNRMGSIEDRFEKSGVDMPENWNEMEREDRQSFMQENDMEGRYMQRGGKQRQHPDFRQGNRRGGQGENMNGQRKNDLRERFQGWMGQ